MTDMPLRLNARSIDRHADRALHRQLADLIREAIDAGELRPGEALPSEAAIGGATDLSRTTVREAIDIVAMEGRVTKRPGAATRVVEPPPVRHMATERYARELAILREGGEHPQTSAFSEEHGVDWADYTVDADYRKDTAGSADAVRLGVAARTPVLRRHLLKLVAGEPVQIQESVMPYDLVAGTPVADPQRQPWPGGTIAELFSIGIVVTRVVEEAYARHPTVEERRKLALSTAGQVWEIVRIFYADDRGVECSTVVVPAERNRLRYETDLS